MKTLPSEMLIWLVSMILCAGCSVKENRNLCPCRLVLDFSEVDTSVIKKAELNVTADGFAFTDEFDVEEGRYRTVFVPRTRISAGLWSGDGGLADEEGLHIPYGKDCPPVYFHVAEIDADCEIHTEKVMMRKNHCRLTINLERGTSEAWKISLYGNVDGYGADGLPENGEFFHEPAMNEDGGYMLILPRQTDDSMVMELDDGSGVMKRFSLGEYIAQSGYDWHEPDLKDITIDIDVAFTRILLSIQGWDEVYKFDVVI